MQFPHIWNNWSFEIQNWALEAFLNWNTPFHLEFDVSNNGETCHQKIFGATARKPGERSRQRKPTNSNLIQKSEMQSTYVLLLLFLTYC